MGSSTSKALSDVGSVIGNALATPFKAILGRSCKDVCVGIWDVVCFIEHICIADLVKFLLVCCLSYICLIFLYMFYKLGICQCFTKIICKMCWATCETSCLTLDYICCFCWHKIRHTKRVYRGRRRRFNRQYSRDVELGCIDRSCTSTNGSVVYEHGSSISRKRKSCGEVRRRRMNRGKSVRLKKEQVSVNLHGKSHRRKKMRNQMSSLRKDRRTNTMKFKKQRTR